MRYLLFRYSACPGRRASRRAASSMYFVSPSAARAQQLRRREPHEADQHRHERGHKVPPRDRHHKEVAQRRHHGQHAEICRRERDREHERAERDRHVRRDEAERAAQADVLLKFPVNRVRRPPVHPPREEQNPERRGKAQLQADALRGHGTAQQNRQQRCAQRRQTVAVAAEKRCELQENLHDARADDGRCHADHQHVKQQHKDRHRRARPPPVRRNQHRQQAHEKRAVQPRDGEQVAQPTSETIWLSVSLMPLRSPVSSARRKPVASDSPQISRIFS